MTVIAPDVIVCQVCGYATPGNEDADRAEIVGHVKAEHPFLFAVLKAARAASEESP
jgi:hypothetical protein